MSDMETPFAHDGTLASDAHDTTPDAQDALDASDGPETLIAAFFQSLFQLSFDGTPYCFSPSWEHACADVALVAAINAMEAEAAAGSSEPHDGSAPDTAAQDGEAQDAEAQEEMAEESAAEDNEPRQARFPSGPIPRDQPGLAARRLSGSLLARLYYAITMAEVFVFPHNVARSAAEKAVQNGRIARTIGLNRAVETGLIEGYVICWPAGRYPKTARSIRLQVPGGRRERGRALGELEGPLRAWVKAMREAPDME